MFPRRDRDDVVQCLARRGFPKECKYSIPPRRIEAREIYVSLYVWRERRRKRVPTRIEVYIEIFAPCGFSVAHTPYTAFTPAPALIVGSRLTVTLGVHQPTKPKQGDSRGRSRRIFRKGTLSPPELRVMSSFRKVSLPPLEKQFILRSWSER